MPHERHRPQEVRSTVVYGELLAALLAAPMNQSELQEWVREHDAVAELADALADGAVRLTSRGGARLNRRPHREAMPAMLQDLLTS